MCNIVTKIKYYERLAQDVKNIDQGRNALERLPDAKLDEWRTPPLQNFPPIEFG